MNKVLQEPYYPEKYFRVIDKILESKRLSTFLKLCMSIKVFNPKGMSAAIDCGGAGSKKAPSEVLFLKSRLQGSVNCSALS